MGKSSISRKNYLSFLFEGGKRFSWKSFSESQLPVWGLFLVGCFFVTFLLSFKIERIPTQVKIGFIAQKDIKADQSYEIVDERSTQKNREEAFSNVPPVYDYDEEKFQTFDQSIQKAFEKGRGALNRSFPPLKEHQVLTDFQNLTGVRFSESEGKLLLENHFSVEMEMAVRRLVKNGMSGMVVEELGLVQQYQQTGIVIRRLGSVSNGNEILSKNFQFLEDVSEVQRQIREQAKKIFDHEISKKMLPSELGEISARFIRPNLTYNAAETEWRKNKTVLSVKPVIIKIQAGESIVRSGDRYEPWHQVVLQGIQKKKQQTNAALKFLGNFLFVGILILVTYTFSSRYIRKFNPRPRDLLFLSMTLMIVLLCLRIFVALAGAFRDSFPFEIDLQVIYYAIPIAAGSMLVRLILNSEVAIIFSVVIAALTGIFLRTEIDLSIYFLISSIAAAGMIAHADRRSLILKAGLLTGCVSACTILSIKMIQVVSVTARWDGLDLLLNVLAGLIGGMGSAFFVLFVTPIVETVFGYTTDIKLLELGNLHHPLLQEMIVKAPGTYHHSQLVAVLAESAAQSIHANPILARVGAYFHDVGKMTKPLYFIENQQGGENRHDKLAPSMSALIIASHVKDGIELAKRYKLPSVVVDMIPQHQGTKLMTYFYNKAKEQENPELHEVQEKDYRYPGPKPQTREAGILLLSDAAEAAVRSMPEKSAAKIQTMVQKIINKSFTEEQLDECDLTLRDLKKIADSFIRVLIGIYHQRIVYPDMEEKKQISVPL